MLLILGPDRLLYRGPPVDGAMHRHHALQLASSGGTPLQLQWDEGRASGQGFAIAADTPHQLQGGGPVLTLLYLEPETADAQALQSALQHPAQACAVSADLQAALMALDDVRQLDDAALAQRVDALCTVWLGSFGLRPSAAASALDARVASTLAHLAAHPEQHHSAALLAERVHLSPDRLMHLFAEVTGISLRSYALWARLKTALRAALQGASLTDAAHAAGFADSAHLSHSFKALFGLPPRFLFEQRDSLHIRFC